MKRLTQASPLGRVVATLGVLIIVQSVAVIRYGAKVKFVKSELPVNTISFWGTTVSIDRLILVALAVGLTFCLWFFYRRSQFGISTTAVAENQRTAGSLGLSADKIAALNWALGSGLAGMVAIFLAPISSLQVTGMTTLVIAALAAALVASFRSFPIALYAGLAIGVIQTILTRYVHIPGVPQSLLDKVGEVLTWPASHEQVVAASKLVPDEIVQMLTASGTPAEARAKVKHYIDHGCTSPILYPLGDVKATIDTFAGWDGLS